jgi:threonine dehydrogenase-like Zn-dependent dehydrogenase
VIGSWYGDKLASLELGGQFHRNHIQLISSQVSSIAPALRGRWDKSRRLSLAWRMLAEIKPSKFITHCFNIEQADEAYHLLDSQPEVAIQVIIQYE